MVDDPDKLVRAVVDDLVAIEQLADGILDEQGVVQLQVGDDARRELGFRGVGIARGKCLLPQPSL